MIKKVITPLLFLLITGFSLSAQETNSSESYGGTLNLGVGVGYYGYLGHPIPSINVNYEFDVARNFTLAPFISFFSYGRKYKDYRSTHNVIPIGIKGTYYFDDLLDANSKWDFYGAGSAGFAFVTSRYDEGYFEDERYHRTPPLHLNFHIGAEYHISSKVGIYLDLSTGMSTLGLAIHR